MVFKSRNTPLTVQNLVANGPGRTKAADIVVNKVKSSMNARRPAHSATMPVLNAGHMPQRSGRKRALMIGIKYENSEIPLSGCINDVMNMRNFLIREYGFEQSNFKMILEEEATAENILTGCLWLVESALPNDSLFLHFSGHGVQVPDEDGDEADGYDEAICPYDFQQSGVIVDDDLNEILVRHLPAGARLTVVFDCCHSGSALDLPFEYHPDGNIVEVSKAEVFGGLVGSATRQMFGGSVKSAASELARGFRLLAKRRPSKHQRIKAKGSLVADVVFFSGCKDSQVSIDAQVDGNAIGAMSYALITALTENKNVTYGVLLKKIRAILAGLGQTPQVSSARFLAMDHQFKI